MDQKKNGTIYERKEGGGRNEYRSFLTPNE